MILAFLDESARGGELYYMGALMVGAAEARKLEKSLDEIVADVAAAVPGFDPATELHGYEVFHQKEGWDGVPVWLTVKVCKQVAKAIHDSGAKFVFRGIDVQKLSDKYTNPHPAHALALSHALESVQHVLNLDHTDESVLVLADEHHTAPDSRTRFRGMRAAAQRGFTSIALRDLIDTIYFGLSNHSLATPGGRHGHVFDQPLSHHHGEASGCQEGHAGHQGEPGQSNEVELRLAVT